MIRVNRKYVWNEEDIAFLRENYGVIAQDDIALKLGVSQTTVRLKAIELGIADRRLKAKCDWTDEKIEYLKLHYANETNIDIARHIGFSPGTVVRMAVALDLRKSPRFDKRDYYNRYVRNYKQQRK